MSFVLSKNQLLFDLYKAFYDAKKHKSNKSYILKFESNLDENLSQLCNELWNRTYQPRPSNCFIITYPKKREVFAADFRDRIVHHLYYNYTYQLFDNTFIEDSYSCRKEKGTHFGIKRLEKHIRQESLNYTRKTFILKMDIMGYFIHINRLRLLEIVLSELKRMSTHKISKHTGNLIWSDKLDFKFIYYLSEAIILLDPTKNCIFRSKKSDWDDLPKSKTLFLTDPNCGLPIGNLTSQLFSNVYLNALDQYIKRSLKCKHYGRYVDDFYIVSHNKNFLKKIIPFIENFLLDKLLLETNKGKTQIINYKHGVEFLGAFIKPFRNYISNNTLKRINKQLNDVKINKIKKKNLESSINSFLGILGHYKSFNLRKALFQDYYKFGYFNTSFTKFKSHYSYEKITSNWKRTYTY